MKNLIVSLSVCLFWFLGFVANPLFAKNMQATQLLQESTFQKGKTDSYSVTFVVKDEQNNPVEHALVNFNGVPYGAGGYVINYVEPGIYPFFISKTGFQTAGGMVEVIDNNVAVDVVLALKTFAGIAEINIGIDQPNVEDCFSGNVHDQYFENDWLHLFPNPNQGHFTLQIEKHHNVKQVTIIVTDLSGKELYKSLEETAGTSFTKALNLTHLPKGAYLLHVFHKDRMGSKKLIIY